MRARVALSAAQPWPCLQRAGRGKYCSRRCNQKAVRNRRILIDVLTELEAVRIAFDIEDATEEDHRVA